MTAVYALLAIFGYVFVGLFSAGFIDIDPSNSSEVCMFWGAVMLWPIVYIATVIVIVGAAPIRFGKTIGNKYRPGIEKILEKSINLDVLEKEKGNDL